MWKYECNAGTYTEDSLIRLLISIVRHRLHHFSRREGFKD